MRAAPVLVGGVIDGKYAVESVLGRGGMGTVVRARHLVLGHAVAIKFPLSEPSEDREIVVRALREARAAVHLKSEHVCRVLDVGELEGTPYIVMELLDGLDLATILRNHGGPLPEAVVVSIVAQVCDALGEAHELGIVHRDIKPQNLFVARKGRTGAVVKVIDFGISRVASDAQSPTSSGTFLGSPLYVSPEQMVSTTSVDGRTDIWALGVCLYQLATGEVPFKGTNMVDQAVRIARERAAPPSAIVPELSAAFDAVVLGCLKKKASERFADVGELLRALEGCAKPSGGSLEALLPELVPSSFVGTTAEGGDTEVSDPLHVEEALTSTFAPPQLSATEVGREPLSKSGIVAVHPRRRWPLPVIVGIASLALVIGAWLWLHRAGAAPSTHETPAPPAIASPEGTSPPAPLPASPQASMTAAVAPAPSASAAKKPRPARPAPKSATKATSEGEIPRFR